MAKREIFSVKALKEKKYHTMNLAPEYAKLMGEPERKFTAIHYGESGSGKSVHTLKFANYFAKNFGKVLYNSHEESVNKTIQDRIINFNIDADNLFVANAISFSKMCDYIQKNYYKLIILDSVKYMSFTIDQLKELRSYFSKRQISVIMIDFGSSKGSPASGKDLIHASDIKMYFKDGTVHSTSRYLDKPIKTRLFTPENENKLPSLFDNV